MKKPPPAVSEYLSAIGTRGGKVKGIAKGFAALTPAERTERAKEGAAARWKTKKGEKA